jgi:hypothetical protein
MNSGLSRSLLVFAPSRNQYLCGKLRTVIVAALFYLSGSILVYCQSESKRSALVVPETGFISRNQYTNAFFGFSLPLHIDATISEKIPSLYQGEGRHLLLAFSSESRGLASFTITAEDVHHSADDKDARRRVAWEDFSRAKELSINGKTFWRSEGRTKGPMRAIAFSTPSGNYVLRFEIVSYDPEITLSLEKNLENITFFDPSKSASVAGLDSRPYQPGKSDFPDSGIGRLAAGSVSAGMYSNPALGFRYEFPGGWVANDKATQQRAVLSGQQFVWSDDPELKLDHKSGTHCTRDLLLVTRHPEGMQSNGFNPLAFLIAADPACALPVTFPRSVKDKDSIQNIASQLGIYFRTYEVTSRTPSRIRAFENGGRVMLEVSQSLTVSRHDPGSTITQVIRTSVTLMQAGDYWVMWMFAADNDTDLDRLRTSKIFFDAQAPASAASQEAEPAERTE